MPSGPLCPSECFSEGPGIRRALRLFSETRATPIAGYRTGSGYDATTGWGTPQAPAFFKGLASMP